MKRDNVTIDGIKLTREQVERATEKLKELANEKPTHGEYTYISGNYYLWFSLQRMRDIIRIYEHNTDIVSINIGGADGDPCVVGSYYPLSERIVNIVVSEKK